MTDTCDHNYEKCGYRGGYIFSSSEELEKPPRHPMINILRCSTCGDEKEEPASTEDLAISRERARLSNQRHVAYHAFQEEFDGMSGWEMMEGLEAFRKKFPEHVHIAGIDDDMFCSSDLVFIEHRHEKEYWGTTVVVVPQCTGENPIRFFMYPGHLQDVLGAIAACQRHNLPGSAGEAWDPVFDEEEDRARIENHWVVVRKHHVRPDVTAADVKADLEIAELRRELRRARIEYHSLRREVYDLAIPDEDAEYQNLSDDELIQKLQARVDRLARERDDWEETNSENLSEIQRALGCSADTAPVDAARVMRIEVETLRNPADSKDRDSGE